jgi:hypothetical protein
VALVQPTLNPAQERVLRELMGAGEPRPEFSSDLSHRLRDRLKQGLAELDGRLELADQELYVSKSALGRLFQCERYATVDDFEWNAVTAKGAVAHRAIELGVFTPGAPPPLELVDLSIARHIDDDGSIAGWLRDAPSTDIGELRARASDEVISFFECFPPIKAEWRPRTETPVKQTIGRITLQARVDLAFGRSDQGRAGVLIIDLKTGRPYPGHVDDLRFYALLQTLKIGVPPFRTASYYLDAASWHHEDVTEELLEVTVRRVIDGANRLGELQLDERTARFTSGPACGWCRLSPECEGAAAWASRDRDE